MTRSNSFPKWLALASGLAIVAVVTGGAWFYRSQEEHLRRQAETELRSIAQLKADQIADWRRERLADAYVLMESPFLSERVAHLTASPDNTTTRDMLTRFRSLQKHYHYSDILLVDADGQVRLRIGGGHGPLCPSLAQSLAEALRERRPVLTDIDADRDEARPHISVVAPIHAKRGAAEVGVGAIVLRMDARQFLYPLIKSWPTSSHSAETQLVRRDGDSALFLNDVRFRKNTALKLRTPLSRRDVPSVMAVRGRVGVMQGKDYRGVEVLSALQAVPDSPWFLVAKVDTEEVLAVWRSRSVLILVLTLVVVVLAVIVAGLIWQGRDRAHYHSLARAQAELRESEENLSTTLRSISDGFYSLDDNLVFTYFNSAAETILEKSRADVIGKNLFGVFPHLQGSAFDINFTRAVKDKAPLSFEAPSLTNDLWYEVRVYPQPNGIAVYFQDIAERKRAEEALRESGERLQLHFLQSPLGVVEWNTDFRVVRWNPAAEAIFGHSPSEAMGQHASFIVPQVAVGVVDQVFRDLLAKQGGTLSTNENVTKDGRTIVCEWYNTPLTTADGTVIGAASLVEDVTEQKLAEDALRESESRLRVITDSAQDAIMMMDPEGLVSYWNAAAERVFGYTSAEAIGQNLHSFIVPPRYREAHLATFPAFRQTGQGSAVGKTLDLEARRKDGKEISVQLSLSAIQVKGGWHAVGIVRDITERKQAEDELLAAKTEIEAVNRQLTAALTRANKLTAQAEQAREQVEEKAAELGHQATHDALTGLPNRHHFEQYLSDIITGSAGKKSCSLAVLFLDLDRFKLINDTLGHKVGDLLLVEVAKRLQSCLRPGDALARMGGDEFTVMLQRCRTLASAESVAARMIESISRPFEIQGHKFVIGVSIGITGYPSDAADPVTLIKYADAAMYKAKELGRNSYMFFSEEIRRENQARVEMEQDLRLAIERDELQVYYQPIVDIRTMRLIGAEALLRWDHPVKGIVSPSLFIPVAEETGLIVQLGKTVLATACKLCKSWHDAGFTDMEISVNVSPAQLRDMGFVSEVDNALNQAGLPTRYLKLEVIETVLARNDNDELDVLSILRTLGVSICIDDFGMGHSSLSRLNNLPIDHLKIDGHFIRNIEHNRKDRAMAESMIVMAHNLGMQVTAEWVEDQEQMAIVESLNCDYAQGYLISPALSAEALEDFIREWEFGRLESAAA